MEASSSLKNESFVIINNIPKEYHARHLRKFFSAFIETNGFPCFHYRHRPEVQKPMKNDVEPKGEDKSRRVSNCCIVKVAPSRVNNFLKEYNGEQWLNDDGKTMMTRCFLKKIIISEETTSSEDSLSDSSICKKGTVSSHLPLNQEKISKEGLESLIELHPPSVMPNGNVGTTSSHFLAEIKSCRLPPSLITKLGLQFPRAKAQKKYSKVPFEYQKKRWKKSIISDKLPSKFGKVYHKKPWDSNAQSTAKFFEENEDNETDSEGEEWDRHEALHDDVTSQERTKERLFEDEIELKWEKGGSGLVFYTDAQYWDMKEGDFDAKTSDDWDIDTRVYTQNGPDNDKDMRDLVRMKLQQKLRDGTETKSDQLYDFAAFEKYSTGFGRKVLEAQGWKQGEGVGRNACGISEPIPNDGQRPFDKKGLGYHGEKLIKRPPTRRKRNNSDPEKVFISSIYDDPDETEPTEPILTTSTFARLKFRKEFQKANL